MSPRTVTHAHARNCAGRRRTRPHCTAQGARLGLVHRPHQICRTPGLLPGPPGPPGHSDLACLGALPWTLPEITDAWNLAALRPLAWTTCLPACLDHLPGPASDNTCLPAAACCLDLPALPLPGLPGPCPGLTCLPGPCLKGLTQTWTSDLPWTAWTAWTCLGLLPRDISDLASFCYPGYCPLDLDTCCCCAPPWSALVPPPAASRLTLA
jgi:hypothetical protein